MSEYTGIDNKSNNREVLNDVEFVFETKLLKMTEELKLRREIDVQNETKIKNLVEEKHELQKLCEKTVEENKTLRDFIEKLKAEHRKINESKYLQLEDDKASLALNIKRQNEEISSLRNDARSAELEKLSLEKQIRDAEHEFKIHKSSCEKHVSHLTELNNVVKNIQQRHKQLTTTQERLENYIQKSVEYIGQLQSALQHDQCIFRNMQTGNNKLTEELNAAKSQFMNKTTSQVEKELKEEIVKMDLKINSQLKQLDVLNSENNKFRAENERTMSALLQANLMVNKYMDKSSEAIAEIQKLQEVCQAQEIDLERNKNFLRNLLSKSTRDKEIQTQVDDDVKSLMDHLMEIIDHNFE